MLLAWPRLSCRLARLPQKRCGVNFLRRYSQLDVSHSSIEYGNERNSSQAQNDLQILSQSNGTNDTRSVSGSSEKSLHTQLSKSRRWAATNNVAISEYVKSLEILRDHTSKNARDHAKQTVVLQVQPWLPRLTQVDAKQLFLIIQLQYECHVQYYIGPEARKNNTELNSISIRGYPEQISKAISYLKTALGDLEHVKSEALNEARDKVAGMPRSVWTIPAIENAHDQQVGMGDFQWSGKITMVSFAEIVEALTTSTPNRNKLLPFVDPSKAQVTTQYRRQVVEKLVYLFSDASMSHLWSTKAINMAISFLCKQQKLPEARQILDSLLSSKSITSASVLETMMEFPAKKGDVKNFQYHLQLLIKYGFRPTWKSWTLLVRLIIHHRLFDAEQIVQEMQSRNLLEDAAAKVQILETLIPVQYPLWMSRGGNSNEFIAHRDDLCPGIKWMTSSSLSAMLLYHAQKGQFEEALKLRTIYLSRGAQDTSKHLEILLHNAHVLGNVDAAVNIIASYASHDLPKPFILSRKCYGFLFRLAWRRRYLNMVRVIWRYSCVAEKTDMYMFDTLQHSLKQSLSENDPILVDDAGEELDWLSPDKLRRQNFDKFAATLTISLEAGLVKREFWQDGGTKPIEMTIPQRLRRLKSDSLHGQKFKPIKPFPVILGEAYLLDRKIKQDGLPNRMSGLSKYCLSIPVLEKSTEFQQRAKRRKANQGVIRRS